MVLFFGLLTGLKLRARTSFFATAGLANYSEFGLIVAALGARMGWLPSEWLVTMAIAVSITFVLASPLNASADAICLRLQALLDRFERPGRIREEEPIDPGSPEVVVVGMGRVGVGVYDRMRERYGDVVLGLDQDIRVVQAQSESGRRAICGSIADPSFMQRLQRGRPLQLILLAIPNGPEAAAIARVARLEGYEGPIAATAHFDDQVLELEEAGVDVVFNFYADAGAGFAEHVCKLRDLEGATSPA
jgi:hypothetical protein